MTHKGQAMYVKFTIRMSSTDRAIEWDRVEGREVTVHLSNGDKVRGVARRSESVDKPLSNVIRVELEHAHDWGDGPVVRRIPTYHVNGFTLG